MLRRTVYYVILLTMFKLKFCVSKENIFFAVNCGGSSHIDSLGIAYSADTLAEGSASDYGKSLTISRVHPDDIILYQTERYDTKDFSYKIPIPPDGEYVLILKFSEVWFRDSGEKVFSVAINNYFKVIENLDIAQNVGFATAHDEYIPIKFSQGQMFVNDQYGTFNGDTFTVDFLKGIHDNPKINAIVLMRGSIDDVPRLPELERPTVSEDLLWESAAQKTVDIDEETRRQLASGPRTADPYASTETSYLLPILVSIVTFLPILFCLCKL